MRVKVRRVLLLALSITLSGCGAADRKSEQADRKSSPSTTPTQATKSAESADQKTVTATSLSGGKYVASLEGLT